jgi:uncharacterized protein YbcI
MAMAQQIAETAIAFEEHRLGRRPKSVTVLLGGGTLVITMYGVLSTAEIGVAKSEMGLAQLRKFHQYLFNDSSEPLKLEIMRITGLDVCKETAAVQVFSDGTVVQVFLLSGRLPTESWEGP